MTTPARRRLLKDYKKIREESRVGIMAVPMNTNIFSWYAII